MKTTSNPAGRNRKQAYQTVQLQDGVRFKTDDDRLALILGGEEISTATWKDDRKQGRYVGCLGCYARFKIERGLGDFEELHKRYLQHEPPPEIPGKGQAYMVSVTSPEIRCDSTTLTVAFIDDWHTCSFQKRFKTVKEAKRYCEESGIAHICHGIDFTLFCRVMAWRQGQKRL